MTQLFPHHQIHIIIHYKTFGAQVFQITSWMLPPALVDLTLAQVASRWPRTPRTAVRYLSQSYKLNVQPRIAWQSRDENVALSSPPIPLAESNR